MTNYEREMWALAETTASFSKDPSTQVGAVAAVNKRVIGTGRNGFPPGVTDDPEIYKNRAMKLLLTNHAEKNLVAICGDQIRGGDIFVTFPVCNDCAGLLITAGVKRVFTQYMSDPTSVWYWRWNLSKAMFAQVGIETFELIDDDNFVQCSFGLSVTEAVNDLIEFLDATSRNR